MSEFKERVYTAVDWTKLKAGRCSTSMELEDVKYSVKLAKDRVGRALRVGEFLQKDSRVFGKLTEAHKLLGEFGDAMGMVQDICKDIDALPKIHSAVRILSDENIILKDPDKAALAIVHRVRRAVSWGAQTIGSIS